jgi:hypothetical protein
MSNKIGVIFILISLSCSILLLGYWANYTYNASNDYDKAKEDVMAARENLAKAYADMPWTLDHIIQDINAKIASGQYDRATGDWLIQRVQEMRAP